MAQQAPPPSQPGPSEPADCRHHWSIQPATGPFSRGECLLCGDVREFKNYVEAATWGDSRLANRTNTPESQTLVKPVADPPQDKEEEEEDS